MTQHAAPQFHSNPVASPARQATRPLSRYYFAVVTIVLPAACLSGSCHDVACCLAGNNANMSGAPVELVDTDYGYAIDGGDTTVLTSEQGAPDIDTFFVLFSAYLVCVGSCSTVC